jgi:hypothetical protein
LSCAVSLTVIVRARVSDIGGNVPFRSILPKRLQNKRATKIGSSGLAIFHARSAAAESAAATVASLIRPR